MPDDSKESVMDRQPFLKSGIVTLLAGVSLTAAFAATGFIAAFGREQFLGIHLNDWSVQTLTLLAGRCAADSFFLALNLAIRHLAILVVTLLAIGAAVVVMRHRKAPGWMPPAAESLVAVPLLVWVLLVLIQFEAPTIALRGWILPPNSDPLTAALSQLHLRNVQVQVVEGEAGNQQDGAAGTNRARSRTLAGASAGVTRLNDYYFSSQKDGPGVLLLQASSEAVGQKLRSIGFPYHKPAVAQNLLYGKYAWAVAACLLSMIFVVFSRQCPESKFWSDLLLVLRCGIILVSSLATLMLPYVYGKLVDSTIFPDAYVTYEEPSIDPAGGKPTVQSGDYPVLSQDDKSVSLLWIQAGGGHTQIIQVPREKVLDFEMQADVDILERVSECITSKGQGGGSCQ